MALSFWDPFQDLRKIQREMNSLFDARLEALTKPEFKNWNPGVDVKETEKEYIIHVELPGVKKEDVHVEFHDGTLTVSGERKYEKKEENEKYHRIERSYGKFQRSFYLGDGVSADSIQASLQDGVLEITAPKPEKKTPEVKKIAIN